MTFKKVFQALSVGLICMAQSASAERYDCHISDKPNPEKPFPYIFAVDGKSGMVGFLDPRIYAKNQKLPLIVTASRNSATQLEVRWKLKDIDVTDHQTGSTDQTFDIGYKARINKKSGAATLKINIGGYGGVLENGTCKRTGKPTVSYEGKRIKRQQLSPPAHQTIADCYKTPLLC